MAKLGYFLSIFGKRKYLSYEEFLLMADFIVSQYREIYILNNNIYMEQYPVEECFDSAIRAGLLTHFAESEADENDDSFIGDIDEYVSIFEGLKEYNGYLLGVYNEPSALQNMKVHRVDLFERKQNEIVYSSALVDDFIDLIEESDYIELMKFLFAGPDEIYIRTSNYTGDINKLNDHIALVAYY